MKASWKRSLAAAVSVFVAAASVMVSAPCAYAASAPTASTTDYLNLRAGMGTDTKVLLTLGKNVSVTVLDSSDSQWTKVQTSGGQTGYCFKRYLSLGSASGGTVSSSASSAVTTDNLNLRQSASMSGSILTMMKKGTSLTVLNLSSGWVEVQTPDGLQGWCSKTYLSISGGTASSGTVSSSATAKTTDYLNLRSGAGLSNRVLLTLGKGVTVTVADNSNSQWVEVLTSNGAEGWCSRQYLTISGGTSASSGTSSSSQSSSSSQVPSSQSSSSAVSSSSSGSSSEEEGGDDSGTSGVSTAVVTADVLRLREQANTSSQILANLPNGTSLQVLAAAQSGWVKVRTADGKTGYVSADYVQIQDSNGGSSSGGSTSTGSGTAASAISLSSSSQSVPSGKTLYLKATTNPSGADVTWTSSNTAVATVVNGYVTALMTGSAVITAVSGSASASCSVSVTAAEPVRTAYVSPNVAAPGQTVTLTAITDASRDGVQFQISKSDGSTSTVNAAKSRQETENGVTTKVWTGTTTFSVGGSYSVLARSSVGGAFSTGGFTTSAFVSTQSDPSVTTSEDRRASDSMVSLIAKWEGYRSCVYADTMTSGQVPTIGYGCTFSPNAEFYNGISETEAWSMMVNRLNDSSYTSELNKMIRNNNFLMNQQQADCLISFAYNVGAGYFNSSNVMDFIKIMKNAVRPPDFSSNTTYDATITKDTELRSDTGILSAAVSSLTAGTSVLVTGGDFSDQKDGWYRVQLTDGTAGWVNSGYVSLGISSSLTHDLNYTNTYAFGTELIRWNQAGGKFYTGLFYRRLGEANVYNYGDYNALRYNKYGYGYPSAAASLN